MNIYKFTIGITIRLIEVWYWWHLKSLTSSTLSSSSCTDGNLWGICNSTSFQCHSIHQHEWLRLLSHLYTYHAAMLICVFLSTQHSWLEHNYPHITLWLSGHIPFFCWVCPVTSISALSAISKHSLLLILCSNPKYTPTESQGFLPNIKKNRANPIDSCLVQLYA